ncbi:PIN domain-containing protein [Haladaptatus sp. DYF46]|uniref:type II toxin-antitoxin system VapC family toxin n=1 Tax=Haladaptatus sp. DYF46 TaxID=2886041 RepID=UPI001E3B7922
MVRAIDHGDLPVAHVTDYVLGEVLNILGRRAGHDAAIATLDTLIESAGFEIVRSPKADFTSGQALYRQYPSLTFVDALTTAYMQREGIEYVYSFDDDFDVVEDIRRLNTASDPF